MSYRKQICYFCTLLLNVVCCSNLAANDVFAPIEYVNRNGQTNTVSLADNIDDSHNHENQGGGHSHHSSPDDHLPAGIGMGHVHKQGDFMLEYKFMTIAHGRHAKRYAAS